MFDAFGILMLGYGFIVVTFIWTWTLASGMSRLMPGDRMERPEWKDALAVAGLMAFWTIAWIAMMLIDALLCM